MHLIDAIDWKASFSGWELLANGFVTTFATALGVFGAFWLERYDGRRREVRAAVGNARRLLGDVTMARWAAATTVEHGDAVTVQMPPGQFLSQQGEISQELLRVLPMQGIWFLARMHKVYPFDPEHMEPAKAGDPAMQEIDAGLQRMLGFWFFRRSALWYNADRLRTVYDKSELEALAANVKSQTSWRKRATQKARDWLTR